MKIRVVRFCTLPLVATSQKHLFWPLRPHEKWKMHFYVETEKHKLQKLLGMQRCTSPPKMGSWLVTWQRRPRELRLGSTSLWKSSPVNPGMPCLVFFLGDTSLTMTPCNVFPFFWFFLNSLVPPSKSRSNSRCHRCVPGGLGTMVWSWLQGPTPSGDLQVIFPNFFDVHFL
jgi:hypothetical protein